MIKGSPTFSPLKGERKSSITSLPESIKKRSTSSLIYSFNSQFCSATLMREIDALNSRLKRSEKFFNEIRSEIPQNMNQMLEKLELSLKTINSNLNSEQKPDENSQNDSQINPDILEQLEHLETELKSEIKAKFSDYDAFIKNEVNLIANRIQRTNNKQENQFEKHSNNIDDLINNIQKKEQKKLDDLEILLNKLKKYKQPFENINKYSDIINSNSSQIKDLQKKLSKLTSQVDIQYTSNKNDSSDLFITASSGINTENKDTNRYAKHLKIFEAQNRIENIQDEINMFREKFNNDIIQTYNKIQNCEIKIIEIEHMAEGLTNSFNSLDNKLGMEEILIKQLFDKIEMLDQKTENKADYVSLQTFAEQIKSTRNNMRSILSSIKNKVQKCETTVPLITFD